MYKRYLEQVCFPFEEEEDEFFSDFTMTCYNTYYPFYTLPKCYRRLELFPLTILYGGNGSGKTTYLNLIAEKLGINRRTRINRSSFMDSYVEMCKYQMAEKPEVTKIITSDDVFANIFSKREKNEIIDEKREEALEISSYGHASGYRIKDIMDELIGDESWIDNIDTLKKVTMARRKTASSFVKETVGKNIIEKSNGETALEYFYSNIEAPGLYLLDEPENSLSAVYQRQLAQFLFDSVRFFNAQLVIATHSPFILSIPGAKIYNLDSKEFSLTEDWTALENMIEYYKMFNEFSGKFKKNI